MEQVIGNAFRRQEEDLERASR
ncbi:uncharacterized protein G2W53_030590 [Senna tora]|uniref:Uncharacterized protein n=1 Tax=Senna tora TaxID=362788 RepID=A0A834WEQ7_9FABA|nr:uncharacterized protein G2W53_030590 [Senna tora]